ncbi:MAG: class I SAM-dependent methyltransferase [Bacteroidota bacterium]
MAIVNSKISAPESPLLSSFHRANMALNHADPWIKYHNYLTKWVDEAAAWVAKKQVDDKPQQILDVACGTGSPSLYFARQYPDAHLEACDLQASYLEIAACLATEQGLKSINFTCCGAEKLPYADGTCDMLSCFFSLMYFQNKEAALDEFLRVVRPGGSIWITTWAKYNALFDSVRNLLPTEYPSELPSKQPNPHSLSDEEKLLNLLKGRSMTAYTIHEEQINLRWEGAASALWDFVKASNPDITRQLQMMEAPQRIDIDRQILEKFNEFSKGEYLLFPVAMIVSQIQR